MHDQVQYTHTHTHTHCEKHSKAMEALGKLKGFGLFKRHFCRTKVGSLKGIVQAVNDSAECNFAQLVCNEDDSTIVPTYDWTDFFAPHLRKITGIKKYHHFRCDSSKPGMVYVKEHADTEEIEIDLMKITLCWSPDPNELPSVVSSKGLSAERQWYLHDNIRPFCPDGDKDITCPLPDVPKPGGSRPGTPAPPTQQPVSDNPEPPPPKRKRLCGTCRQGHCDPLEVVSNPF